MRILVLIIAVFFCNYARSQSIALPYVPKDTLFFNNGSIMIGKIKNVKLGIVTFDLDDAPDITVELRKLKTMIGKSKIFRLETVDDQLYFGTILPGTEPSTIIVQTMTGTVTVPVEGISIMNPFDKEVLERFSGNIGLGYTYTKSSGFGRLNFDATIKYVSKKEELSLTTSGIYTIYDSLFSRDKEDIFTKYNYYFIRNWFATAFLSYQRNLELGLQRRYQEGLGIGNKFIRSKSVYTWGRTGFVLNQERSTEGVTSGTLAEAFGQLEVNFFRFAKPKLNIMMAQAFFYNLSQKDRFRNDGSVNAKWEIIKDFYLNLEFYNNYDSKPPVAGSSKFDYGVVYGISYKFY